MEWVMHNLYGYILIKLRGFSPERFLNLCSANQIEIWGLEYIGDGYQFFMTVKGYRKVKPLVRKAKVRLTILGRFGLPFFLYRNRKRKLFFTGVTVFFLLLYTMSLFVWDIRFDGNHRYTDEELLGFLQAESVDYGVYKGDVECEELERCIRNEFPEITWVSARISGTRLIVQVKENEVIFKVEEKSSVPCDLVAKKDGVITSMIVRAGVPMVKAGDAVTQGQVLVSGILPIYNDAGEMVNAHLVTADADIMARTETFYSDSFSMFHETKSYTGKTRHGFFLKALNQSIVLLLPKPEGTTWDVWMQEEQVHIFESFYLPLYYGEIAAKEYCSYETAYSHEEAEELAKKRLDQFIQKIMEKGVQNIENNVKIHISGSNCTASGVLTAEEAIGRAQTITEPEENQDLDEYIRNND